MPKFVWAAAAALAGATFLSPALGETPIKDGGLDALGASMFTQLRDQIGLYELPVANYVLMQRVQFRPGGYSFPNGISECVTADTHAKSGNALVQRAQYLATAFSFPGTTSLQGSNNMVHVAHVGFFGDTHGTIVQAKQAALPFQASDLRGSCPVQTYARLALFVVPADGSSGSVLVAYKCLSQQSMSNDAETVIGGKTTAASNQLADVINNPPSACAAIQGGDFSALPIAGRAPQ